MTQDFSPSPGKLKVALAVLFGLVGVAFVVSGLLRENDISRWVTSWWNPDMLHPDGGPDEGEDGAYLVLQVEDGLVEDHLNTLADVVRRELRSQKIAFTGVRRDGQSLVVTLTDGADHHRVPGLLGKLATGLDVTVAGDVVRIQYTGAATRAMESAAVDRTLQVLRNRLSVSGADVSVVRRQGDRCIFVDLSGATNPQHVRDLIEQPARVTFHLVADPEPGRGDEGTRRGAFGSGWVVMPKWMSPENRQRLMTQGGKPETFVIKADPFLTGDHLIQVVPGQNEGDPLVSFRFDTQGTRRFEQVTRENIGRNIAIVFEGEVISTPSIVGPVTGGVGNITGSFTDQSAMDLSLLLTAGAVPDSIRILEGARTRPGAGYDRFECGGEPGASGQGTAQAL